MELEKGQLRVHYNEGEINPMLDKTLEKCLAEFGYKRWASGMMMETHVRDIAFERAKED